MNGRQERELIIREKNKKKLAGKPLYLTNWYNYLRSLNLSENTCRDYINKILAFLQYINSDINTINIQNIKMDDIVGYISNKMEIGDKEASDSYKQCIWSALNNFFDYCVKAGTVDKNYMTDITRSKNHDIERIKANRIKMTPDLYKKILDCVKNGVGTEKAKKAQREMVNRNLSIFLLLMTTGMRKAALDQINISDINFDTNTISVTDKGKKKFEYTIAGDTLKYLKIWINEREKIDSGDALFVTKNGKRLSDSAIDKLIDKYSSEIVGKHMSAHKFRSGFCTISYEAKKDIEYVRRAVGHSNVSTTQRYVVTKNDEMEKAAKFLNNMISL